MYKDEGGGWRWRRRSAGNGRTTATSGEAFSDRHEASQAAARENPGAVLVVVKPKPDDAA